MIRRIGWVLPGLAVLALAALTPQAASAAPKWVAGLAATSSSQSRGGALATPAAPTATCATVLGLSNNINITWTAVAKANRYTLSRSNGTTTTTFPVQSTLTYADNGVPVGTYTYKVVASIVNTSWVSPPSPASNSRTITQPLVFVCT